MGASEVIDYTKENFAQNGQKYDVIFDAVGWRKISYSTCKILLSERGKFIPVDLETMLFKHIRNKRIKSYLAKVKTKNLEFLRGKIEVGKIKSIVVKVFLLIQLADAHQYYENGHLKGKIIIKVLQLEK